MESYSFEVVRPPASPPEAFHSALFLAGPSPRTPDVPSWRPRALQILQERGYTGVVFVPEPEHLAEPVEYDEQLEWEHRGLHLADAIVFWVPRELSTLPGFTTNVEFGAWVESGKCVYGRPADAPKTRYLDRLYSIDAKATPHETLEATLAEAVDRLGAGALRRAGERWIPLHLWRTPMFQSWHERQKQAGNTLREARLRWAFVLPGTQRLLAAVTWVDVWVDREQRAKSNEWIFSRADIASVVLFERPEGNVTSLEKLMKRPVVLVREFRSSARSEDGFVRELPGGSSVKQDLDPRLVAAAEVREETGLEVDPERFQLLGSRQAAATVSTHHVHLYAAALTRPELKRAEHAARTQQVHGNESETERTVLEVLSLEQMLKSDQIDWSTLGMLVKALFEWRNDPSRQGARGGADRAQE